MPGATPAANLQEMRVHLDALSGLVAHPGWKVIRLRLSQLAGMYSSKMMESHDPNLLLKVSGALNEVVDLDKWPERQIEALRAQIQQMVDKAKLAEEKSR